MWSCKVLFLVSIAVGALASNSAWKPGAVYKFRTEARTLTAIHQVDDVYAGILIKGDLEIRPASKNVLIAQLNHPKYASIQAKLPGGWNSPLPERYLDMKPLPLSGKPFEIRLEDGLVVDLVVNKNVPTWEVNLLKSLASQLQVNTEGKNLVSGGINIKPNHTAASPNAVFRAMEDSITGKCEVLYDIAPLPQLTILAQPYLAPLVLDLEDTPVIEIVKTQNYSNCDRRIAFNFGFPGNSEFQHPDGNQANEFLSRSTVSRVIISGSLDRYTIQSSLTTSKVVLSPLLYNKQKSMVVGSLNLTLEAIRTASSAPQAVADGKKAGSLGYTYENAYRYRNVADVASSAASSSSSSSSSHSSESSEDDVVHSGSEQKPDSVSRSSSEESRSSGGASFDSIWGGKNEDSEEKSQRSVSASQNQAKRSSESQEEDKEKYFGGMRFKRAIHKRERYTQDSRMESPEQDEEEASISRMASGELQSSESSQENNTRGMYKTENREENYYLPLPALTEPLSLPMLPLFAGISGKSVSQKINIVDYVRKMAQEIASDIHSDDFMAKQNSLEKYSILIDLIRSMGTKQLQAATASLYSSYSSRSSSESHNIRLSAWRVFRDAVAEAGTAPALLVLKDWIANSRVEGEEAAQLLAVLPSSAIMPTPKYLHELFKLVTSQKVLQQSQLNVTALIAFAKLIRQSQIDNSTVHKYYPVHTYGRPASRSDSAVHQVYIPHLKRRLGEAVSRNDSVKIQVYTYVLGAIGHPVILKIFEPYLERSVNITTLQRTLMVISMSHLAKLYPEVARQVLFKIYQNTAEEHEVRCAAVQLLMTANPPRVMLQRMAEFTNYDVHTQVNAVVKTGIQTLANLKGSAHRELSLAAKSAVSIMNSTGIPIQSSRIHMRSYESEKLPLSYTQELKYIGSDNSAIPKSLYFNITRNHGGFKKNLFSFGAMVSSVPHLIERLKVQLGRSQRLHESLEESTEYSAFDWETNISPSHISELLGLKLNKSEPTEGNFMAHVLGQSRFFAYDSHTINKIPDVLQQVMAAISSERSFNFTKFYNEYAVTLAFPVSTGLPFVYTLKTPSVISVGGKARLRLQLDEEKSYSVPKSVNASGQLNIWYSSKIQAELGFVTPFDNTHYLSGVNKDTFVNLPAKAKVDIDVKNKNFKLTAEPIDKDQKTTLFYYSTTPFIVRHNILNLKPIQEESSYEQIVNEDFTQMDSTFGEKSIGMSFQVHHNASGPLRRLTRIIEEAKRDLLMPLYFPTADESLISENISLSFIPQKSSARSVVIRGAYASRYNTSTSDEQYSSEEGSWYHPRQKKSKGAVSLLPLSNSQKRIEEFIEKASHSIKNSTTMAVDLTVQFPGEEIAEFMTTAAVARSPVDEYSRIVASVYQKPASQSEQPLQAVFEMTSKAPYVPLLNFKEALKATPYISAEASLGFGATSPDANRITAQAKFSQSKERQEYVSQNPMAKLCESQMAEGNNALPACRNVTAEANYMDQLDVHIKYNHLPVVLKNITYKSYSHLLYLLYPYVDEDVFSEDLVQNQIKLKAKLSPNLKELNVSLESPIVNANLEHFPLGPVSRQLLAVHPVYWAAERFSRVALGDQLNPKCTIGNSAVNTFDNKTYPVLMGKCWHVMLKLTPKLSYESELKYMNKYDDVAVLVRDAGSYKKEVKINTGENEIDLLPSSSHQVESRGYASGKVRVNGVSLKVSSNNVTKIYNNQGSTWLELYNLPSGEISLHYPQHGLEVLYDGKTIQLSANNSYKSNVGGLCGTWDGEPTTDFKTPIGYYMNDSQLFSASWSLPQDCQGPVSLIRKKAVQQGIVRPRPNAVLVNLIDNEDIWGDLSSSSYSSSSSSSSSQQSDEEDSASRQEPNLRSSPRKTPTVFRTKVIVDGNEICFSIHPIPACAPGSHVTTRFQKTIPVYCINSSNPTARKLKSMVESGANPDLRRKGASKYLQTSLPKICSTEFLVRTPLSPLLAHTHCVVKSPSPMSLRVFLFAYQVTAQSLVAGELVCSLLSPTSTRWYRSVDSPYRHQPGSRPDPLPSHLSVSPKARRYVRAPWRPATHFVLLPAKMWSCKLLLPILVAVVVSASPSAWKSGTAYRYQLSGRTLTTLLQGQESYTGIALQGQLELRLTNQDVLSSKILHLKYASVHLKLPGGWNAPIPENSLDYKTLPLSAQPFEIKLKDGLIDGLVVSGDVPDWELNILKAVVSLLQVDTEGKDLIRDSHNARPNHTASAPNAVYRKMEDSVTGNCEVLYDIAPLPPYLVLAQSHLAPLLRNIKDTPVIEVVKTQNYSNCDPRVSYSFGFPGNSEFQHPDENQVGEFLSRSSVSRIVISGNLRRYTIQSSVTTNKVIVSPILYNKQKAMVVGSLNLTLESLRSASGSSPIVANRKEVKRLAYSYENVFGYERESSESLQSDASSKSYSSSSSSEEQPNTSASSSRSNSKPDEAPRKLWPDSISKEDSNESPYTSEYRRNHGQSSEEEQSAGDRMKRSAYIDPKRMPQTYSEELDGDQLMSETLSKERSARRSSERDNESGSKISRESASVYEHYMPLPSLGSAPSLPMMPLFTGISGKSITHKVNVVESVRKISSLIARDMIDQNAMVKLNSLEKFTILTEVIRTMSLKQLQTATSSLYYSMPFLTSSESESQTLRQNAWVVFRDAVSQSGTAPALMAIKDWIQSSKVKGEEAAELVAALPSSAITPTPEYLKELFKLATSPEVKKQPGLNKTVILEFTNLLRLSQIDNATAHKYYPVHVFGRLASRADPAIQEEYLPYLEQSLKEAVSQNNSAKIQVYIRAIGNVAHPRILDIFEPYLEKQKTATTFQRTLMVVTLNQLAKLYPKVARNVLFKIYQNPAEAYELRSAAVFLLFSTNPPAVMLQRMAEFTNYETDMQVKAAVISGIKSLASLKGSAHREVARIAKSALSIMNNTDVPLHFTGTNIRSNECEDLALAYSQTLNYIGSDDSILPKAAFYNVTRNVGGFKSSFFSLGGMVSSVDHLMKALKAQSESSEASSEESYEQQFNKKWTVSKLREALNFKTRPIEPLEGNLMLKFAGMSRFFAFDENTIEKIPAVAQGIVAALGSERSFGFTKFYNQFPVRLAFPMASGLPFVYALKTPTVVAVSGNAQIRTRPDPSSGSRAFSVPRIVNATGELDVWYASKINAEIGFITSFDSKHYIAGIQKNVQINLPVRAKIDIDVLEASINLSAKPINEERETTIFQYNVEPYIVRHDILNLKPVQEEDDYEQIANNRYPEFEKIYGEQSTGMAFSVRYNSSENLSPVPKIFAEAMRDPLMLLYYPWAENQLKSENATVTYKPLQSSTKILTASLSYAQRHGSYKSTEQPMEEDIEGSVHPRSKKSTKRSRRGHAEAEALFKIDPESSKQQRLAELLDQVDSGIAGKTASALDICAKFEGERKATFVATAALERGPIDENSHLIVAVYSNSVEESEQPLHVYLNVSTQEPNVPLINFKKALKANPIFNVNASLYFDEPSGEKSYIIAQAKFNQSEARRQYIEQHPMAQLCESQMAEGNNALPACRNVTAEANYMDQLEILVDYDNLPAALKNATYKSYSLLRSLVSKYVDENVFPESTTPNHIRYVSKLSEDLKELNISVESPLGHAQLEEYPLGPVSSPLLAVHPVYWAAERISRVMLEDQYNPKCSVGGSAVSTFDNSTYPIHLGRCWHVAMILAPKQSASADHRSHYVPQINQQNDVAVLVRDAESAKKDVKIIVGLDEVDITPSSLILGEGERQNYASAKIQVNDHTLNIHSNNVTEIYNEKGDVWAQMYFMEPSALKLKFPLHGLKMLYDGETLQLSANDTYRNTVLGLCGTADGQKRTDFLAPNGALLNASQLFTAIYSIPEECQGPAMSLRRKAWQKAVVSARDETEAYNFIDPMDFNGGISLSSSSSSSSSESQETSGEPAGGPSRPKVPIRSLHVMRTTVFDEVNELCFSVHPLPACARGARPSARVEKNIPVYCLLRKNPTARKLKTMVDNGLNPDLRRKGATKYLKVSLPKSCVRA
ncbi:uncharacterized protein LOC134528927 [Bacillus rossius redtenbacheri]|uniref:uncharacterized protein LOC134528927 n=1 Tax=Bacillus rossius redtenbacheri TaxID=93214 RepID=UPI002FDE568E